MLALFTLGKIIGNSYFSIFLCFSNFLQKKKKVITFTIPKKFCTLPGTIFLFQ